MEYDKCQVVLCVQNEDKTEFLVLKTNLERGHFWQNITGHIEEFENIQNGAIREAMEETGLEIQNIKKITELFDFSFFCDKRGELHEKVFLFECSKKWPVTIDSSEHEKYQWLSVSVNTDLSFLKFDSNRLAIGKSLEVL